jgi:hypothetical protein
MVIRGMGTGSARGFARERRPSGWPSQPAAVLHHLVRPRASLRTGLAEPQPRRVPCRRPRPVTHMMPGIWVVLIPVTPFPATICSGELRASERADLRVRPVAHYSECFVCHLLDPLRRCWPCAWPGGPGVVVAAAPAAGCSRIGQPMPRRTHCPARQRDRSPDDRIRRVHRYPRQGRTSRSEGMVVLVQPISDTVNPPWLSVSGHAGLLPVPHLTAGVSRVPRIDVTAARTSRHHVRCLRIGLQLVRHSSHTAHRPDPPGLWADSGRGIRHRSSSDPASGCRGRCVGDSVIFLLITASVRAFPVP